MKNLFQALAERLNLIEYEAERMPKPKPIRCQECDDLLTVYSRMCDDHGMDDRRAERAYRKYWDHWTSCKARPQ